MKIHMLSGNAEYKSQECLTKLAGHFTQHYGWTCTMSRGTDRGAELPDLGELDSADVLVVFCKRMTLPAEQLGKIQAWCRAGKPVVGIRTASHAFQTWLEFDREILGGSYNGHGGDEAVCNAVEPAAATHPILNGMKSWTAPGKVYRNPMLASDVTVLLRAQNCAEAGEPLAWCRTIKATGGRVFYTLLGHPADFDGGPILKLLANAVAWTATGGSAHAGQRYVVAQLPEIEAKRCPCGFSRRAFTDDAQRIASIHMVDITIDAKSHYHKRLTEIYLILEGEGHMELDGTMVPVKPLSTVLIKPGCRHRAVGKMRIVNIPIPAFDPSDEWFD